MNAQTANVIAIAIDPERPSTLYAATYKDGVYKSTDGGRSWRGAGVGQGVRSIAIDPRVVVDRVCGYVAPRHLQDDGWR